MSQQIWSLCSLQRMAAVYNHLTSLYRGRAGEDVMAGVLFLVRGKGSTFGIAFQRALAVIAMQKVLSNCRG